MKKGLKEKNNTSWNQVRRLLDDESPVVRKGLVDHLKQNPNEGIRFLEQVMREQDNLVAKHAHSLLVQLGWVDGVGDFLTFIRSLRYELESGWFLLDRTIFSGLDISSSTLFLDRLADRARELLLPPHSSKEICAVLNRVLFHEFNFRAASKDF